MKKNIILIVSLIGTLALTGCASTSVKVDAYARGGSNSPTEGGVRVTVKSKKSSGDGEFDASLASIDLSSSNVSVVSPNGSVVLTIKDTTGMTVASQVFGWYNVADVLHPTDSEEMSDWINANIQNNYELLFDVTGIETSLTSGTNTITAIFNYNNSSVGGSDSFYLNNADINGF